MIADDLSRPDAAHQWPVFAPEAVAIGVAAVFALLLRIGAIRVGVVTLHRGSPGTLTGAQLSDALILADLLCLMLIDRRNGTEDLRPGPEEAVDRSEVHQATGMIAVQLGVSMKSAFGRLRAYAYLHDRALSAIAADVISRRLRFEPDDNTDRQHGTDRQP